MDNTSGVICINKPSGMTSHDAVNIVRRLFNTRQVGHTGTLDPLATGVLPVMVGRAVKASEYLLCDNKVYQTSLKLGFSSDTGDSSGTITKFSDTLPSTSAFFEACRSFIGKSKQTPPMYSALKINGQKLVDLARKGIEVERTPRDIEIFSMTPEVISEKDGEYSFEVACSKGTYIRTLCEDIGKSLGTGAYMTSLCRKKSGFFTLENSVTFKELEKLSPEERYSLLMPTEALFAEYKEITFPPFFEKLSKSGNEIYLKKLSPKPDFELGEYLRLKDGNGEFYSLGQVKDFDGEKAIKPVKFFVI